MSAWMALRKKNGMQFRNSARLIRRESAFKVVFVLLFASAFEAGLFYLFRDGFRFLDSLGGAGLLILNRLFSLFFLAMGTMLVVSGVITSYASMFRSPEVPFLLVRPLRASEIVLHKFLESTAMASWAFLFIMLPFVGAYAWHERASPLLSLWTVAFSIPFLVLCSAAATILTFVFVRWMPSRRVFAVPAAVAIALLILSAIRHARRMQGLSLASGFDLSRIIPGWSLASHPLLPNWWVAEGMQSLAHAEWMRGFLLWLVLLSNAAMLCLIVERFGHWFFYDAWQRVAAGSPRGQRAQVLLPSADRLLSFLRLPHDVRALLAKDIRVFLRDPMQWSQALVFFGLLAVYFANVRALQYHTYPDRWRNMIAFLNIFSVSAVMCSLGSRFVFPQLSLEGQGFWIVGLSPTSTTRILLTKFVAAWVAMTAVSVSLMALSSHMLDASPVVRSVATVLACAVSLAVCALSTGLGAVFLDLNQPSPAAIVSGLGGTLTLVLCLVFMLAAILPFAFFLHAYLVHRLSLQDLHRVFAAAFLWLFFLTAASTVFPLWLGARRLRRREF
jgi:ABC-2 type transport system permease protein